MYVPVVAANACCVAVAADVLLVVLVKRQQLCKCRSLTNQQLAPAAEKGQSWSVRMALQGLMSGTAIRLEGD